MLFQNTRHNGSFSNLFSIFVFIAEKLQAINGLSLEYTTQYCFGRKHIYLPIECVHDIVINEVIFGVSLSLFDQNFNFISKNFFLFKNCFITFAASNHLHVASIDQRYSIPKSTSGPITFGRLFDLTHPHTHYLLQNLSFVCHTGFESENRMHPDRVQFITQKNPKYLKMLKNIYNRKKPTICDRNYG